MNRKKAIYEFAMKYYDLYMDLDAKEEDVREGFADQCEALGFTMDWGQRFIDAYSLDAFYSHKAFKQIADDIDDVDLLGSVIYSRFNHVLNLNGSPSLLAEEHSLWFAGAFARLADLTAEVGERILVYHGPLKELHLISARRFLSDSDAGDHIEQRLTIRDDGYVALSCYRINGIDDRELMEDVSFEIPLEAAREILSEVDSGFDHEYCESYEIEDCAWYLTLTNTQGRTFTYGDLFFMNRRSASGSLSDLIRTRLDRDDLLVFDGNPDYVTRVEVDYDRITQIKPRRRSADAEWEYLTWHYHEKLVIDRETETLEHIRDVGTGCTIKNTYYVQDGITAFLDGMHDNSFLTITGDPDDAIDDPKNIKTYTITIHTKQKEPRTITGSFDLNNVPTDWAEFIDDVYEFIAFYGIGELFDDRIYGKPKRRSSDLIFCHVSFEEGGHTYTYLADTDDYEVGDFVVVPAGEDNHEAVVRIESIEYRQPDHPPYSLDQTKHILRLYEEYDDKEVS